jgi:hypothetical protein
VRVAVVGFLCVFVRQLQEQQVGELLQVVAITHAVVAQGVAEVPDFLDEGGGVHGAAEAVGVAKLPRLLLRGQPGEAECLFHGLQVSGE